MDDHLKTKAALIEELESLRKRIVEESPDERKQVKEALRESEEHFRIAALSTTDAIWNWNIKEATLEWFGDIDKMLGYNPGEFPRTIEAWEKMIHPDDHDRVMATLEQHFKIRTPYSEKYRVMYVVKVIRTRSLKK